jgi:hypothetical protein
MTRPLIVAVALLAALPAAASADTVKGTVVARDAARGTIAAAGRDGTVATLRVARAGGYRAGVKVRATAAPQADGTYRASVVKRLGRAGAARVRGTLVRHAGRDYVISSGASTFTLRSARAAAPTAAGAVVHADVKVAKGKVAVKKLRTAGQAATLELEGTLTAFDGSTLSLQVEGSSAVSVAAPAGVELTAETGDDVELLVTAGPVLGLLAIDGEIEASGAVAAVAPTSITVGGVTCAVPDYLDVTDILVGDAAYLVCVEDGGVLTADEIELDDEAWVDDGSGDDDPELEDG